MSEALSAADIMIIGSAGDEIRAYQARPHTGAARGGVVVIHHMPGLDRWTREVVRRFAVLGYDTACPDLYWREAPGAAPDDAAAAARARGGVPDERLIGDVAGTMRHLRSLPTSNGRIGVIGYCSGGRQSVLVACTLDVSAAVDCYGAFVTAAAPPGHPVPIADLTDRLGELGAPLLGLFGQEDLSPSPTQVDDLDRLLTAAARPHEFHRYPGAGHAFFNTDRPAHRPEAAMDGWARIASFFEHHLGS